MKNLPLHLKYRPNNFDEIQGNTSLIESLKAILKEENKPKTYLLQGLSGAGKTTLARIIGKEVGARDRDIKELNIADVRGIDAARNIIENARYMPLGGKAKVYILDEVANATNNFFEALLKTLEEPPKNSYFVLCTTDPQKLPKTIKNRCTVYQVEPLRKNELIKLIKKVLIEEKRRKFPKDAIEKIAKIADGCPRQALVVLGSVINMNNESLLSAINDFSVYKEEVFELCRALLKGRSWKEVAKIIKGIDEEPESVRYVVLNYMSKVLLGGGVNNRAFLINEEFGKTFIYSRKSGLVNACYALCAMGKE